MNQENEYIRISIIGTETRDVTTDEVGLFLYDFTCLYELVRLALDSKYKKFRFSRFSLYRNKRPLRLEDKMVVEKLRHESPIEAQFVIAIASGVTAISTFITMLSTIYNLKPNRKKLELEIQNTLIALENAELEKRIKTLDIQKREREELEATKRDSKIVSFEEAKEIFDSRKATNFIEKIEKRLKKSPIQIETISFDVVDRRKEKSKEKILENLIAQEDKINQELSNIIRTENEETNHFLRMLIDSNNENTSKILHRLIDANNINTLRILELLENNKDVREKLYTNCLRNESTEIEVLKNLNEKKYQSLADTLIQRNEAKKLHLHKWLKKREADEKRLKLNE